MKADPKQRPSLRCAGQGCKKKLPEAAIKNLDPFCSTACCHEFHGVVIQMPGRGYTVGSSS